MSSADQDGIFLKEVRRSLIDGSKRMDVIEANQAYMFILLKGEVHPDGSETPGIVRDVAGLKTIATQSLSVLRWIGGGIGTIAIAILTLAAQMHFGH